MDKMFELHPVIIIRGIMYKYLCHAICRTVFRMHICKRRRAGERASGRRAATDSNERGVHCLRARCTSLSLARHLRIYSSFFFLSYVCCLFFISSFCCYLFRGWGYNNKSRRGRSCRRRVPFNSPLSFIRLMQFFCAALCFFLRLFFSSSLCLINGFYYFGKANITTMNYWLRLYFLFLNFRLHYCSSLGV